MIVHICCGIPRKVRDEHGGWTQVLRAGRLTVFVLLVQGIFLGLDDARLAG